MISEVFLPKPHWVKAFAVTQTLQLATQVHYGKQRHPQSDSHHGPPGSGVEQQMGFFINRKNEFDFILKQLVLA